VILVGWMPVRAATWIWIAAVAALAACGNRGPAREAPPPEPNAAIARPVDSNVDVADVAAVAAVADADAAPPPRQPIELTFVGDIMFGRWGENGRLAIPPGDYNLFEHVKDLVRADIAVANLETPVVKDIRKAYPYSNSLRFTAIPDEAQHLVRGGFTHVSLANNHGFDWGIKGVQETPENLRELGITPIGLSYDEEPMIRAETFEQDGWRIAFIGITTERNYQQKKNTPLLPWTRWDKDIPELLVPVVTQARKAHDLVIVVAHWGWEYENVPRKDAQETAHALIDAGADLIVGHHPHVLQPIARHEGGLIAYSLGNFRFDQKKQVTKRSGVLRVRFDGRGCLERAVFHPVEIVKRAVASGRKTSMPAPAEGKTADGIRDHIIESSAALGTTWELDGDGLVLAADPDAPPCNR